MKAVAPTTRHLGFRTRLLTELGREFADVPAEELLALTCQIVGQMAAMQDRRRFSPAAVMQIISDNIQRGNQDFIHQGALGRTEGNA